MSSPGPMLPVLPGANARTTRPVSTARDEVTGVELRWGVGGVRTIAGISLSRGLAATAPVKLGGTSVLDEISNYVLAAFSG